MTHRVVSQTPVVSAAAIYASGDAVGGKLEFTNVCSTYRAAGRICQAKIKDNAKQNALLQLVLFKEDFTATADNAAFSVTDADLANCIGVMNFAVANYTSFDANSIGTMGLAGLEVNFPYTLVAGGTSLSGQLMVLTSTPTYAATDDLQIDLTVH